MTEPGHKEPLGDLNGSPNLSSGDPSDPQLRIGQEVPEPQPKPEEVPPGLQLTESEQKRVDGLTESGQMSYLEAVLHTTTTSKAKRIIGHSIATDQVAKHEEGIAERQQKQSSSSPSTEELVDLLRSTSIEPTDNSPEPTDKAA
ncbi:MAG TPA: hypothetical protein VLE51_02105 [Candidatus Saccharimonadales bacterium]|nr:hypothetical protein [Candidatus Saccharimonadales bacterium]